MRVLLTRLELQESCSKWGKWSDWDEIGAGVGFDTCIPWSAGRLARTPPAPHRSHDPLWTRVCCRQKRTCSSPSPHPDTLQLVEERKGDGSALDASGSGAVAERDGATLRLKEGGGVFYAPGPLQSVAVHWPRLVAGARSGALYHLEVQG